MFRLSKTSKLRAAVVRVAATIRILKGHGVTVGAWGATEVCLVNYLSYRGLRRDCASLRLVDYDSRLDKTLSHFVSLSFESLIGTGISIRKRLLGIAEPAIQAGLLVALGAETPTIEAAIRTPKATNRSVDKAPSPNVVYVQVCYLLAGNLSYTLKVHTGH